MIIHTAAFQTHYALESQELARFLFACQMLSSIKQAKNFTVMKQISSKNDFQYALYMEFDDQEAYDTYNQHPVHVQFVEEQWQAHVKHFIELDYLK